MGKFGIGARVVDVNGYAGTIEQKRKGERRVRYDIQELGLWHWDPKRDLSPEPASISPEKGENEYSAAEKWVPKVRDRVRFIENYGGAKIGDEGVIKRLWSDDGVIGLIENDGEEIFHFDNGAWGYNDASSEWALEPLTVEAGKYYRTRDGRKFGPMRATGGDSWPFKGEGEDICGSAYFNADGTCPHLPQHDLVAEWAEPAAVAEVPAKPVKLIAGGTYLTRDGRQVGPIRGSNPGDWDPEWVFTDGDDAWRADGSFDPRDAAKAHDSDLVALVSLVTAAPKFKVGDRVVIARNSRGHNWLDPFVGKAFVISYADGTPEVPGWAVGNGYWWPEADLDHAPTLPIGSTVTFTATGRLSAINENGHYQVTFPGLAPAQNSFAVPAQFVTLAN